MKRGDLSVKQENYQEAIKIYDEGISLTPEQIAKGCFNAQKGACLFKLKDYAQALESFKKALRLAIKHESNHDMKEMIIDLHFNIGQSYLELEKYEKAITNFNKCLDNDHRHIGTFAYKHRALRTIVRFK
jgi:tetratricopeptide (TPR) repeat protein